MSQEQRRQDAEGLLREQIETIRSMRDKALAAESWTAVSTLTRTETDLTKQLVEFTSTARRSRRTG